MGDLLKGIHLLPQGDFETAVENNQIDDDVIYVTPEDFSSLSREQTKQIAKNTEDIATNKINIENNAAQIESLKNSISGSGEDLVEIKNTIQEIISRDISQDSRLDDIENNYATEEFVIENGGKIDKITVNGIEQIIADKTVNLVVPDTSAIEDRLAKTVNLDEAQTITGPKTFTEHIYLANSDGTIDRISHLNNNFIIHSGATNSAVLNIDEGLSKIYAFNKELAFKSDIAETVGTTVYIDGTGVVDLSFSSDPQTQINDINTRVFNLQLEDSSLSTALANTADKTLSNVSVPRIVADGQVYTGAGDRVIETYISSDGKSWYRKWASGWKECGLLVTTTSTNWTWFTLPIAFSNTNYTVAIAAPAKQSVGVSSSSKETQRIYFALNISGSETSSVYCCGY